MRERRPFPNAMAADAEGGAPSPGLKSNERLVRGALIAQFAASDPVHFADAAELIWPHVDGIDLNCGTPYQLSRICLIIGTCTNGLLY